MQTRKRIPKVLFFLVLLAARTITPSPAVEASTSTGAHADLTRLMEELTENTNKKSATALSLGLLMLGRKEEFKAGQLLVVSLVVSSGITAGLKYLVDRERPTPPNERKNSSFPSGHATASFAAAAVIADSYPRLAVPAYVLAGSVTYSRLYLRRHYPTDVVVGALIGIVTAKAALRYAHRITMEGRGLVGAIIEGDRVGVAIRF